MANWSGTYTNPNPTGTSTGLNSSTSFNDTGASWPNMTNWELRITGGTGSGQVRTIQSNTSITIIITVAWTVIPDATSTYELVLILRDQDHITGNTIFDTGIITELEDSATIFFDGLYSITFQNAVRCNWNKTKSTLVTFQPDQITVQGKAAFWSYIYFTASVSYTINFSYIYVIGASYGLIIAASTGTGDFSTIHHIRSRNLGNHIFYRGNYSPDLQNVKIKYILHEGSYAPGKIYFNRNSDTTITEEYDKIWIENHQNSGISFGNIACARNQIVRNAIFKDSYTSSETNPRADSDKRIYLIDSYFSTKDDYAYYAKGSNVDTDGKTYVSRNVSTMSREIENTYAHNMSITSRFNDYTATEARQNYAIYVSAATEVTSDNDYIAGRLQATPENVDISESTTSTEDPIQYFGLTSARTNAKSTLNKLLECDNVQSGSITSSTATITFDCKNSHAGTTVDQDSNSGQKILYIASTTDFEVNEIVEIGFGTAREEEGEIDTIQAGVSITLKENLTYTHTAVQADTVKKQLRHFGLPFIKYGIATTEYDKSTPIPEKSKWGAIFCEFETTFFEKEFEWKKYGHSIDLEDLEPDTQYFIKACCYTPFGNLMESSESNFTTSSAAVEYTDPGIANVRDGITYKFEGDDKEGVLDIPVVGDVRDGVFYDNNTKEGVLDLPDEEDVLKDVVYDNGTKTGTVDVGLTAQNIQDVAHAVLDEAVNEHSPNGSFGALLRRAAGMNQENYKLEDTTYVNELLTQAKIKIYPSAGDLDADTNVIATYQMDATFNMDGTLNDYKVKRLS